MGWRQRASQSASFVGLVAALALGVVILAVGVFELGNTVRAARGSGIPGTFTADRQSCFRSSCNWRGEFASDDGRVTLHDVIFDGDLDGDGRASTLAPSARAREVYPNGSWAAVAWPVLASFVGLSTLGFLGLAMVDKLRLRRASG